jgi:CRP-like cAMP-binding protein
MNIQIINSIKQHVSLTAQEEKFLWAILIPIRLEQGEFAEESGEITQNMIFVNSGCLMTYFTQKSGVDQVIQFSTSGWWTGDLSSLTTEKPSSYATRALTSCELLLLPKIRMDEMLERFPVFEKYFRIIFQNSLVTHQNRIIQAFTHTADERYQNFQKQYPQLEQFVPLKYIASYLGITPEFLSKIRRNRSKGKS